ncbi:unnamed protein product [Cylindrotheca closterium]|uniref:Uncharacterized protein n=1 Tax=Cylindrotheca closterium TaxID=2856 RepID=A0AAD2CPD6_9STRA|nr:unnamed protein product [Cylindrotheca closterium]CAJ1943804.1 unnamed protein product [Cylindrotheca closterium]CAJ1950053.1 unnamed protein product [Cylindrotheca closterium]CAJ1953578.1 unnamed protein product [Cylindrotheca closterium]CAJ1959227.1 unnamed protein product [Cylindrotheca closterium]
MMLGIEVTPEQVLIYGFEMIGGSPTTITDDNFKEHNIGVFKAHFGQRPSTLFILWQDILNCTNKDLGLRPSDRSKEGLKRLLVAINSLASASGISTQRDQDDNLWHWVKVLWALEAKVISWSEKEYKQKNYGPGRKFIMNKLDPYLFTYLRCVTLPTMCDSGFSTAITFF